jgi:hypothetical protein
MTPEAPSASELEQHPVVRAALGVAWVDSLPNNPLRRHEEGGWIYLDPTTGDVSVVRARPGQQSSINLSNPPEIAGCFVVGKFHTHPNPTAEGWDPGPSTGDRMVDELHGVPDFIQADDGTHFSGPDRRRGGLVGNPGYPSRES